MEILSLASRIKHKINGLRILVIEAGKCLQRMNRNSSDNFGKSIVNANS